MTEREPGSIEVYTRSRLEDDEWAEISLEQTGPDGSVTLGFIFFNLCPLCFVMVPNSNLEGNPAEFVDGHTDWHLDIARKMDAQDVATLRTSLSADSAAATAASATSFR